MGKFKVILIDLVEAINSNNEEYFKQFTKSQLQANANVVKGLKKLS